MTPHEREAAIAYWNRELRRGQDMYLSLNDEIKLGGEIIIRRAMAALRDLGAAPR